MKPAPSAPALVKALIIFDETGHAFYFNLLEDFQTSVDVDSMEKESLVTGLLSALKIFAKQLFHEEIRFVHLEHFFITFYQRRVVTPSGKRNVYFAFVGEKSYRMKVAINYTMINEIGHKLFWKFKATNPYYVNPRGEIHDPQFDALVQELVDKYNAAGAN